MWESFRQARKRRTSAAGAQSNVSQEHREHAERYLAEQAAMKAALDGVPPPAHEAALAWHRGDAVYVYQVNTNLTVTAREQAARNAAVNAIVKIGWQLQDTSTLGGGSLLMGHSIVFTFVRPS